MVLPLEMVVAGCGVVVVTGEGVVVEARNVRIVFSLSLHLMVRRGKGKKR